jgi:RHS repeat-associated protein
VGGDVAYHHYDARGNCTLLTDSAGNIREQYEYDAFGFPYFYDAAGNNIGYSLFANRFLFTGREWLSDLKLYDYRNRLYQPELGRFLQPDPKEFAAGDYNLYRYCHNDPVNKTDAMGLAPGDPFNFPEDAARDVHNFINPTSIRENAEYGSIIYRGDDGHFYASKPFSDGAGTRVNVGAANDQSRVPEGGHRVGDYHSHGDYSVQGRKDPATGKPIPLRVTGPNAKRDDAMRGYDSDHASSSDKERSGNAVKQDPNYRTFLGTPSKEFKEYDKKRDWRL